MDGTGVCSRALRRGGSRGRSSGARGCRLGGASACLPPGPKPLPAASVAWLSGPRELCLHLGDSLGTRSSSPAFLIPRGRAPPAPQNPCAYANHTMSLHVAAATQSQRKRPPAPVTMNSHAHTFRSTQEPAGRPTQAVSFAGPCLGDSPIRSRLPSQTPRCLPTLRTTTA